MLKSILRRITHLLLPVRKAQMAFVAEFAKGMKDNKILEIGSGGKRDFIQFFEKDNEIIQTDIRPFPNCIVLDVTNLDEIESYDIILALNVLEHIYDFRLAIQNMYKALKKGGHLIISIPFFYPLHDLPNDYWRLTGRCLEKELEMFGNVAIRESGLKWAPHSVHAIATKS